MAREWTEQTAKWLCIAHGRGPDLLRAGHRRARRHLQGLWRPPEAGAWASIVLWFVLAVALLFGMDRGIPREGPWSSRLYWMRRVLLVAVFATIAVMAWLK